MIYGEKTVFFKAYPIYLIYRGIWMLLLPLSLIITDIFEAFPEFTENIYAQKIRPIIMEPLSLFFSVFHISITEIAVIIGIIILLISAFIGIKHILQNKSLIFDYITRIIAIISCVAFLFTLTYGGCYYRKSISEIIGLYNFNHNVDDMKMTAEILIDEMHGLRENLGLSNDETFRLNISFEELSELCRQAYASAGEEAYIFGGDYGNAKGVLLSKPWTYTFVMGMYFPFTGEANINTNIPDSELPHTMLHEMAHQRGIAREEDADFAAFYISRNADDRLKYSADLEALEDILNCLYFSDSEKYLKVISEIEEGLKLELSAIGSFWNEYQTRVAEVSEKINNTYLESNGQGMGVAAYNYSAWLVMDYYANQWGS